MVLLDPEMQSKAGTAPHWADSLEVSLAVNPVTYVDVITCRKMQLRNGLCTFDREFRTGSEIESRFLFSYFFLSLLQAVFMHIASREPVDRHNRFFE
jgi:hypothetical protein